MSADWLHSPQRVWLRRVLFQVHLWSGVGFGLFCIFITVGIGNAGTIASAFVSIGLVLAGSAIAVDSADARSRHRRHHARHAAAAYTPPYAAYVVDANTGKVLHAQNENELRHPASVTKVMTAYVTLTAVKNRRLTLDSLLTVSARAAAQAPTSRRTRIHNGIRHASTAEQTQQPAAIGGSCRLRIRRQ